MLALLASGSALAAERYATPGGSPANACTDDAPCDFATAVQGAKDGDEVIVEKGSYTLGPGTVVDSAAISIHGMFGGPRPRLISSVVGGAALSIQNAGSTVSWLGLNAPGGSAIQLRGGLAERLVAIAGGVPDGACEVDGGTLRDSVCVATGTGAPSVLSTNGSATVRNVTAEAIGAGGIGVHASASGSASQEQLSLVNVIAHGSGHDIAADASLGASCAVSVTRSNYANAAATPPATIADDGTQQTAAPIFIDANYHQAAASPTVGHGLTDPSNGTFDFDGDARVVNGATDIGADELDLPPTVTTDPASSVHPVGATLWGLVNPGGPPTTVTFQYGTSVRYGSKTAAQQLGPVGFGVPVSMAVLGLRPGTLYHFRVIATNSQGRRYGTDSAFATPPLTLRGVSQTTSAWRVVTGTTFSFMLNDDARVLLSFTRLVAGRERHGQCHQRARRGTPCVISVEVGSLRKKGTAGPNTIRWRGRVAGHALPPGNYAVTMTAHANGASTAGHRLTFTIVAG